jgi:cytochrome c-type biogenesis protein
MMIVIFIAGVLSILSPCVLPLIPVFVSSSLASTRSSLLSMTAGFIFSFVLSGIIIAYVSEKMFFDPEIVRRAAAWLMILMALAMLLPIARTPFEKVGLIFEEFSRKSTPNALHKTYFFQGATLALIWAPCVGPALGFALGWIVASNTMLKGVLHLTVFGIGAALTLLSLGYLATKLGNVWFRKQATRLRWVYRISAIVMLVVALCVLTSVDKNIEGWATERLPEWWLQVLIKY